MTITNRQKEYFNGISPVKYDGRDYDCETVIGLPRQYDPLEDFCLNIEVNHATLAGHTFTHELQVAADAAHIGGMDTFARALITADDILRHSDCCKIRKERYASSDGGKGKQFEEGKLSLEDLRAYAIESGEPGVRSGKQEYPENIINQFI